MHRVIYLNEYNVLMDQATYFPLVSGLLQSYSLKQPLIKEQYRFRPFLFFRDNIENILNQYQNPAVAAFSVSMWNEQLSLKVAKAVKKKFADCLIVFGGPQAPQEASAYSQQNPFIDVCVRGEGEETFAEILVRSLESSDFEGIPGLSYRHPRSGQWIKNVQEREQTKDLDIYPSPYLEGHFDYLLASQPDIRFQAIMETNRGCPFPCAFCFWGQGGLSRKYRFHSLTRVQALIDWCGRNKIEYLFNADSNFGMHPRDYQIAEFLVEAKKKYGYPDKFRTCFGKNTDEKIFRVAQLLHEHRLEKGITLARQSNDETALRNVNRQNIKLETYQKLQLRFNQDQIPVYSELILGLPGETYSSWLKGIDAILESGIKNQLFVYHAQVYPNTEFADKAYQEKFKIKLTRIPLNEIHGALRPGFLETEYEEIITETETMTVEDWQKMTVFSWVMQLFHSLKLAYYVMIYLHHRFEIPYSVFLKFICEKQMPETKTNLLRKEIEIFEQQTKDMLMGQGRGRILPQYGPIYWDEEEASFLRLSEHWDAFYEELQQTVKVFLEKQQRVLSEVELKEVFAYQRIRIPQQNGFPLKGRYLFHHNFPEFFEKIFTSEAVPLIPSYQVLELVEPKDFHGDQKEYARQIILWGRKSGTLLTDASWQPLAQPEAVSSNPMVLSTI